MVLGDKGGLSCEGEGEGEIKSRTLRRRPVVCFQWLGIRFHNVRRFPSMCVKAREGGL